MKMHFLHLTHGTPSLLTQYFIGSQLFHPPGVGADWELRHTAAAQNCHSVLFCRSLAQENIRIEHKVNKYPIRTNKRLLQKNK